MSTTRRVLLTAVFLVLGLIIWLTWGSVLSGIMVYTMVLSAPIVLLQKYVNADRDTDYFKGQDG